MIYIVRKSLVCLLTLLLLSSCETKEHNRKLLTEHRSLRLEKLNQQRSLIHNNDGADATVFPLNKYNEFSIPNFLDVRTAGLIGSDVNAISYCTSRSFNLFLHNTKVGECISESYANSPGIKNILPELVKLNTDPLEETVKFAHANGFDFFWSNRMNDTHDAGHRPNRPHVQWNNFKEDNPKYLFGNMGEKLPYGRWSAVDYSYPEIRDLCVQYYTEVCENYDVDGIELDFFRHLFLFKNVAMGEVASGTQLEMLTSMVTEIREMTERVGMKRGKPILVLVRIPDSVEYCRAVGIDIETWMAKGLIDIIVGSGYFRLNRWKYLVELGHKNGVKVYAGLSESRVKNESPHLIRFQNAVYRARAAAAWQAGVDGIYSFNEYNTRSRYLREIGEPEKLDKTNNLYFVTYRNGNENAYLKNGDRFANLPILSPENPLVLKSKPAVFQLEVGNESTPAKIALTLYSKDGEPEHIKASLNDTDLKYLKKTEDGLVIFDVPFKSVKPGMNTLTIRYNDNLKPLTLLDAAILFYRDEEEPETKELAKICFTI